MKIYIARRLAIRCKSVVGKLQKEPSKLTQRWYFYDETTYSKDKCVPGHAQIRS